MRDARRGARDLLDRALDGEADGADGLVDRVHGVDRAVRCLVELVELRVHSVHRSSDLVDHGKQLLLGSPDKRGQPREGSAQPHERVAERESHHDQEDGQRDVRGVCGGEGEGHRVESSRTRPTR